MSCHCCVCSWVLNVDALIPTTTEQACGADDEGWDV